ncbi:hypothetical protein [Acuticoccus mangrovi]|uniref:Uncharacterized protein n=1 Tax=Acuticoccus mangrovi TaxID=2796142 RepID=A0A934MDJ0_9HYPH|nr:hypothetical protein [Acuticoccus mangrovi]MBJ3776412.1 hypothetical protein [Acuticoccus mangrovi]
MTRFLVGVTAHGRLNEWVASLVLLGIAVVLMLPGNTFAISPGFVAFARWIGGEAALGVPVAVIGTARVAALLVNGRIPYSHRFRAAGAVLGAAVFMSLAILFAAPIATGATAAASTAVTTYLVLAFGDLIAAWRSGADVRLARRH